MYDALKYKGRLVFVTNGGDDLGTVMNEQYVFQGTSFGIEDNGLQRESLR
jgi:hypothetical protein